MRTGEASVTEVTDETFGDLVLRASRPVLVEHWASWCSPAQQQGPVLAELAQAYAGRVDFVRLDTDTNEATADRCGITSLPTVQVFVHGVAVSTLRGARTRATLSEVIEEHL